MSVVVLDENIAILNENETRGRRGTAPVFGSEKFLFENQGYDPTG